MIKYTYAIYGMTCEADEAKLIALVQGAFPHCSASASFHCATLTVLWQSEPVPEFDEQLRALCEEIGFSLQLPPQQREAIAAENTDAPSKKKRDRGVPISVFVASLCTVLVFAVLFTYTLTAASVSNRLKDLYVTSPISSDLPLLRETFEGMSVYDAPSFGDDEIREAVLRAYVAATGDPYAVYYTAKELEELYTDNAGEMVGIGVSVVNDQQEINGVTYQLITVIATYEGGPAYEAGIYPGDMIYSVVDENGETVFVDEVGQTQAINLIRGVEGSTVTLTVLRRTEGGGVESITLTMERRTVETHSVEYRVCYADDRIGIVEISEFDLTTPTQFRQAMDDLIGKGCTQFIFDLRNNPGGDLKSVEAVLSTMLQVGDPMIYTVDKYDDREVDVVKAVTYTGEYSTCSVSEDEIGKYRGYDMVVLTNQYTASAAELFTANLRDYNIATQVGETTYGKGCMQTILDLSVWGAYFGYDGVEGGLRFTTAWYLPPCQESYHEIGISPEEQNIVALDSELIEKYKSVYLIPEQEDNQLTAAINALK